MQSITMLLPSALSCSAPGAPASRPVRPKLTSLTPYQPHQRSQNTAVDLTSSCRALQAILGSVAPQSHSTPPQKHSRAPSPSVLRYVWSLATRQTRYDQVTEDGRKAPQTTSTKKRKRCEFEIREDEDMMDTPEEKENNLHGFSTPKRQRCAPLFMPLGLSAQDFQNLQTPTDVAWQDQDSTMAAYDPANNDPEDWTTDDDRALVEMVLLKLKLSKREWNDCAMRLGKDQGSLGRRWKTLVNEGNVGLRRGQGRTRRADLDIGSW